MANLPHLIAVQSRLLTIGRHSHVMLSRLGRTPLLGRLGKKQALGRKEKMISPVQQDDVAATGQEKSSPLGNRQGGKPPLKIRLGKAPFIGKLNGAYTFASQLLLHPRTVGAICPSSPELAATMASLIPEGPDLVVEFGAGTGVVTRAILSKGIAPERLVIIEYSAYFCEILRKKFPECTVIQGDAAKLASYLPEGAKVSAIVSSLPLMNLSRGTRRAIIDQVRSVISENGCVIQFTYAWWMDSPFDHAGYHSDKRSMVVLNLPPARVDRFRIA